MRHTEVAAAAALGLAAAHVGDDRWNRVLETFSGLEPSIAAIQLCGWDPITSKFSVRAEYGYSPSVSHELSVVMPATVWGGMLFSAPFPLIIEDTDVADFRESSHFQNELGPAGYEDGLSTHLRTCDGRRAGMLHISATKPNTLHQIREFVESASHALSVLVDPLSDIQLETRLDVDWSGNRLSSDGRSWALGTRPASPLVADPEIQRLAGAFAADALPSLVFLWHWQGSWYQAMLVRAPLGHTGRSVVFVSRPYGNEYGLSPREVDILTGLVAGLGNQAIADHLTVSRRTVETHMERLMHKLDCRSRTQLAVLAAQRGLISPVSHGGHGWELTQLAGRLTPLRTPWQQI